MLYKEREREEERLRELEEKNREEEERRRKEEAEKYKDAEKILEVILFFLFYFSDLLCRSFTIIS